MQMESNTYGKLTIGRMILAGLSGIIVVEIYAAIMQRQFQNTDNKTGKGFAVLGIYLFVVVYCEFLLLSKYSNLQEQGPTAVWLTDVLRRRHAEQHDMAIWSRDPPYCVAKQGHGTRCSISLYCECGK